MSSSSGEIRKTITLRSNDGKEFKISKEEARVSSFIVDTLNLDDDDQDGEEDDGATAGGQQRGETRVVDVLRVSGECLEHVVEFMVYHAKNEMPEITLPMNGDTFNEVRAAEFFLRGCLYGSIY